LTDIIEVARQAGEHMSAATWVVPRRYSEFHDLNKRLRSRYPQVRNLEFPRRQMPVLKLQKDFLEKRRALLEKYLRGLLEVPAICRSRELRAFLSQQSLPSTGPSASQVDSKDFVTRIYNSVTDGMEEFLGNIPVLDQLSAAGQNLITAAATQLHATGLSGNPGDAINPEELSASAEAEAELAAFETRDLEPFVKPICDLFLEMFELNRENNWLRGRAVVLVLQQLLGGTVERKVRENAKTILSDEGMAKTVDSITELVWPGGGARIQPKPRTAAEKARSRAEASVVLSSLIPELVGSVVGRANAQGAARRLLAMLNNERLK
jgi:sorting nexin-25